MKINSSWFKGFAAGIIIAHVCAAGAAYAGGRLTAVTAYVDDMLHMSFNGAGFKPLEADGSELAPILYKDRSYLPVRAVAVKAGVYVDYIEETAEIRLRSENELLSRANYALHCIKLRDFGALAAVAHAEKGVVFSPYAYVEDSAVRFTPDQLNNLLAYDEYLWGAYDGSGDPIEMMAGDYWEKFVYDKDYINADRIGINTVIQSGNTPDNIDKAFPGARFVEYNISGVDPEYEGLDWSSLRLAFERAGGEWMLVGIVRDCWTI